MSDLREHRKERVDRLLEGWDAAEREELARVLAHLNEALERHVARSP
jgi:DNA-binding MarR family transcriptional regulator